MSKETAAVATAAVDTDSLVRLLDTGKITIATVFQRVQEGSIDQATGAAAVAQHSANTAAAAAASAKTGDRTLSVKVSVAGGGKDGECKGGSVGVYGVNARFPIGTYAEGWLKIVPFLPHVLHAIETDPNVTAKNATLPEVRAAAKAMRLKLETIFPRK